MSDMAFLSLSRTVWWCVSCDDVYGTEPLGGLLPHVRDSGQIHTLILMDRNRELKPTPPTSPT